MWQRALNVIGGGGGTDNYTCKTVVVNNIQQTKNYYVCDITKSRMMVWFVEGGSTYGYAEIQDGIITQSDSTYSGCYLSVSSNKLYYTRTFTSGGTYSVMVCVWESED